MHLHRDGRDFSQAVRVGEELPHVARVAEGASLVTDLHGAFRSIFLIRRAHAFGVIDGEGRESFEINVLAGVERVGELGCVQMRRGRDDDRV